MYYMKEFVIVVTRQQWLHNISPRKNTQQREEKIAILTRYTRLKIKITDI